MVVISYFIFSQELPIHFVKIVYGCYPLESKGKIFLLCWSITSPSDLISELKRSIWYFFTIPPHKLYKDVCSLLYILINSNKLRLVACG